MENRLDRSHWLRAARLALLHKGVDGVRVEALARDLEVTKGSFYWHFKDRNDLLETLLSEWEAEESILTDVQGKNPREALRSILDEVRRRTVTSELGHWPSDVAIFAWAAVDPSIAARVNRADESRMRLLRGFAERSDVADLFYYAYQGLLHRRRRIPKAMEYFDILARLAMEMLPMPEPPTARTAPPRKSTTRARGKTKRTPALALLLAASLLQGCTTYRIVRWRDPMPDVQHRIFPERVVRHADVPFQFTPAPQRNDLDTVSVRDVDGKLKPFASYMKDRSIRAFVVIRNDSLIYERYLGGYEPSQRWSSFSVAKSVTSAVLGLAIERGTIGSLDDPVTKYLPELKRNPSFRGITLRNLMEMKSGMAYTRTTGDPLKDLRSDDAHFYYTNNMRASLSKMKRETQPGTNWSYKDSDTELLGWIIAKAAGKPLAAQLEEEVWRKIGTVHDASFSLDRANGLDKASSGFNATALDYARFGRLYLREGSWNGQQILPRDWVRASTTMDTTRTEPEVPLWFRMQHNHMWWIPMHNWNAERDFFADGSRGQRVYVHPPTRTIIVQLAQDSNQDFPFRKVAHYLAGETYTYPRGIGGLVLRAAETFGPDSARATFTRLLAEAAAQPEKFVMNQVGMLGVAETLIAKGKRAEAVAVLEVGVAHYRGACGVKNALEKARGGAVSSCEGRR